MKNKQKMNVEDYYVVVFRVLCGDYVLKFKQDIQ